MAVKKGDVFGRMTVLEVVSSIVGRITRQMATCQCRCGTVKTIRSDGLTHGRTRSCGCLNKESVSKSTAARNKKTAKFGGFSKKYPKTFTSWRSMISRCYHPKQKTYQNYGALGVFVCGGLKKSPQSLIDLIGIRKARAPSLDRFPVHDGNYTCGKCKQCTTNGWELNIRWATRKQQAENRGDFNVHLTAFGKTMLLSQWEKETGIDARRITTRIRRDGWTVERALSTPVPKPKT